MTIRRPPAPAARLLTKLLPRHDHDALLGDLCEEYQRGRSLGWYWMQIVAGIAVGSWKDARAHWVLALRAIAVGNAVLAMIGVLRLRDRLAYFQVELIYGLSNQPHRWLGILGPHTLIFSDLTSVVGCAVSGWVIVRLHRAHGIALVMPFTAVIAVLTLTDSLRQALAIPAALLIPASPRGVFLLLALGTKCVLVPTGILLGGYLTTGSTERA